MYRSDSAVYVPVWQCSVCTGLTVQCTYWSDSEVYVLVWHCTVCTGLTVQWMYWSDSVVYVLVWQCSLCTGLTVQCMYWSDSAVYVLVWQCSVCTGLTVQFMYWSRTTVFDGSGIYGIYCIRYSYIFRRLTMAIFRLYMKYLVSSYTRLILVVYNGEPGGEVGTRTRMLS